MLNESLNAFVDASAKVTSLELRARIIHYYLK